jgi:hypothetical protein
MDIDRHSTSTCPKIVWNHIYINPELIPGYNSGVLPTHQKVILLDEHSIIADKLIKSIKPINVSF